MKSSRQKTIDIIISIVAAIILWIYVINIVNPPTTEIVRDVPISIVGEERLNNSGRALAHAAGYTTDVELSGPRNDVKNITAGDVKLTVDVSNLAEGVNSVGVSAELPSGIKLETMSNGTVSINVEKYVTVDKPVDVVLTGAGEGEEALISSTSLSQIAVSGAASVVSSVSSVRVSGNLSDVDLDVENELSLAAVPVDSSGRPVSKVVLAQETVIVNAVLYQTKSVPLIVDVRGSVWEGAILSETRIPDSITIKGPASRLSQISQITSEPIDITGMYETTMQDIVPILEEGVYESDTMETLHAEFVIAEDGQLVFAFKASDVEIKNVAEDYEKTLALPSGYTVINATAAGPVSTLRTLAAGDVAPVADAQNKDPGYYTIMLAPNRSISGLTVTYDPPAVTISIE